MASRRMYNKDITDSDTFIAMSPGAQLLYFHLNQGADDDGFNNQVRLAMMKAQATNEDLKQLLERGFLLGFESGIVVIRHWRMHNQLRKDRYNPTCHQAEFERLTLGENGLYELGCQVVAKRLPDGCHRLGKDRLDKDRLGKESVGKESAGQPDPSRDPAHTQPARQPEEGRSLFVPPTLEQVAQYCFQRNRGVDPQRWYDHYTANGWKVGKTGMQDWKAAVRTWEQPRAAGPPTGRGNPFLELAGIQIDTNCK